MGLTLAVQAIIGFIDWLFGRAARRAEREAYLAALTAVSEASKANADTLRAYFEMVKQSYEMSSPTKGWTMTDHKQALDEFFKERPELAAKLPTAISDDPFAMEAWLAQEMDNL